MAAASMVGIIARTFVSARTLLQCPPCPFGRKEIHRMKFKSLTAVALLLSAASLASAADAFNVDSRHSEAMFRVRHFMTKVSGKFADVSGVVNIDKANPAASS